MPVPALKRVVPPGWHEHTFTATKLSCSPLSVGDAAEDGVEGGVEILSEIFGEEAEDEAAVLLEQHVFAAVAAVGFRVGEVLRTVYLDGDGQGPDPYT